MVVSVAAKESVRGPSVNTVGVEVHSSSKAKARVLRLSPWLFRICWVGLNVIQGLLLAMYVRLAKLHFKLYRVQLLLDSFEMVGEDEASYQTMLLQLSEGSGRFLKPVAIASAVIATGHSIELLLAFGFSLRHRELRFHFTDGSIIRSHFRHLSKQFTKARPLGLSGNMLCTTLSNLGHRVRRSFVLRSIPTALLIEIVEIACQTAQAYRMSFYVTVPWINRLFAISTTINCWSTPCIYAVLREKPVSQYVATMVIDATLNIFQTLVVPWLMIYPYYQNAPRVVLPIKGTRMYSTFGVMADYNIRQLFPSSLASFLVIVTPEFVMVSYLSTIKSSLVREKRDVEPVGSSIPGIVDTRQVLPSKPADPASRSKDTNATHQTSKDERITQIKTCSSGRHAVEIVHVLLFLWGIVILGCFLFSMRVGNHAEDIGCVVSKRPWLSSGYWCHLVNISCTHNQVVGNRLELEDILSKVEPEDLQELIISDCVELEIPRQIQIFTNVYFVMIYNSTIVSWDMDIALTGTTNPNLMSVAILETELAAIPPALLHFQLPTMLTDIAFSGTNLTSIPDNCHEYWTGVFNIILEASPGITEVPPSLTQMSWVARLSLVGNSISTITDDFPVENMFISIDLSENPLQALPATLGASFGMPELSIKMTNISDISSEWMETYADTPGWMILATGTPLCEKLHVGETGLNGDPSMVATPLPLPNAWLFGNMRIFCDDGMASNRRFPG